MRALSREVRKGLEDVSQLVERRLHESEARREREVAALVKAMDDMRAALLTAQHHQQQPAPASRTEAGGRAGGGAVTYRVGEQVEVKTAADNNNKDGSWVAGSIEAVKDDGTTSSSYDVRCVAGLLVPGGMLAGPGRPPASGADRPVLFAACRTEGRPLMTGVTAARLRGRAAESKEAAAPVVVVPRVGDRARFSPGDKGVGTIVAVHEPAGTHVDLQTDAGARMDKLLASKLKVRKAKEHSLALDLHGMADRCRDATHGAGCVLRVTRSRRAWRAGGWAGSAGCQVMSSRRWSPACCTSR